jgi:hypothetical protein
MKQTSQIRNSSSSALSSATTENQGCSEDKGVSYAGSTPPEVMLRPNLVPLYEMIVK